jgi:pyruvate dehydrogenase (quinone)/pyruvate oxidase
MPHLLRKGDRSFLEHAQQGMKDWQEKMHARATREDMPLKPQVVADALNDLRAVRSGRRSV